MNAAHKKEYVVPAMQVICIASQASLLNCSSDNPYWNGCHEGWQDSSRSWGDNEE